jgi:hypothetical protein
MEGFLTTILPFILSVLSVILSVLMLVLDEKYAYICLVGFILTVIASSTIFYIVIADLFCNNWRTAAFLIQVCVWCILGGLPPFLAALEYKPYTILKGVDENITLILLLITGVNIAVLGSISSIYNP